MAAELLTSKQEKSFITTFTEEAGSDTSLLSRNKQRQKQQLQKQQLQQHSKMIGKRSWTFLQWLHFVGFFALAQVVVFVVVVIFENTGNTAFTVMSGY